LPKVVTSRILTRDLLIASPNALHVAPPRHLAYPMVTDMVYLTDTAVSVTETLAVSFDAEAGDGVVGPQRCRVGRLNEQHSDAGRREVGSQHRTRVKFTEELVCWVELHLPQSYRIISYCIHLCSRCDIGSP